MCAHTDCTFQRGGGACSYRRNLSRLDPTRLKKFDVYQKVHEDYHVRTGSGGLLSLLAGLIIVWYPQMLSANFIYFLPNL